jgi:hypothetical protein
VYPFTNVLFIWNKIHPGAAIRLNLHISSLFKPSAGLVHHLCYMSTHILRISRRTLRRSRSRPRNPLGNWKEEKGHSPGRPAPERLCYLLLKKSQVKPHSDVPARYPRVTRTFRHRPLLDLRAISGVKHDIQAPIPCHSIAHSCQR